ncbi:hypothetical protein ACC677_38630, partial [Rhizobium ruizarguesonis]
ERSCRCDHHHGACSPIRSTCFRAFPSDPVRYHVDLRADTADPDLKEELENSSRLVSDQKQPVSGDLGIVVKARDDR